jgi:hypothetical protein
MWQYIYRLFISLPIVHIHVVSVFYFSSDPTMHFHTTQIRLLQYIWTCMIVIKLRLEYEQSATKFFSVLHSPTSLSVTVSMHRHGRVAQISKICDADGERKRNIRAQTKLHCTHTFTSTSSWFKHPSAACHLVQFLIAYPWQHFLTVQILSNAISEPIRP